MRSPSIQQSLVKHVVYPSTKSEVLFVRPSSSNTKLSIVPKIDQYVLPFSLNSISQFLGTGSGLMSMNSIRLEHSEDIIMARLIHCQWNDY
jgi:hypothetical protein